MEIESWDTDPLNDQQLIFARYKDTGAALTGGDEFTPVDYDKRNDAGEPGKTGDASTVWRKLVP